VWRTATNEDGGSRVSSTNPNAPHSQSGTGGPAVLTRNSYWASREPTNPLFLNATPSYFTVYDEVVKFNTQLNYFERLWAVCEPVFAADSLAG
jgi:hypothetical protein